MITAKPGFIVDPQNPNGVIPDPNYNPVVTPNPTGSLEGTMDTPTPPPQTPQVPTDGSTPTATGISTPPGAGLDPASFMSVLGGVKQNFANNNDLIKQKNLLIKGLFTSPLTPDQIAQLPEDVQRVWNSGNKDAIQLQLQALNERIQGGTNNFATSVNYLVNGYQTAVQQADKQKTEALQTVQNFVSQYGSRAGEALKSLYGPTYLDTLKSMGINIDDFAAIPTLSEIKNANDAAANGIGTIGGTSVNPEYKGVLDTILGSGKFTKDQKASVIQAVNNGEDPFTVVKNQAKNIMGQTEATKLSAYEAADSAMRDFQKALNAYYDGGGDTGILSGNFESVINKLGQVNDPKKVQLATQVAISLQAYRNAISGTAYSEQEGKDISAVFPGINKSHGLNDAIIQGRLNADAGIIDGIYKTALGSSYDKLKQLETDKTTVTKGSLSDSDFVEKALTKAGLKYDDVVKKIPAGMKGVIKNSTGEIGAIDPKEFDASVYTSL